MEVKVRLLNGAAMPCYAKSGDAGLDLYATDAHYDSKREQIIYNTGIALQIPEGYVGLLFPRSSISKTNLTLVNSVGVIDSGYRGEIKVVFRTHYEESRAIKEYFPGDRIAQLVIMPCPKIELKEVETLADSNRGTDGFGSSGK